ncbi:MAG: isoprenyl transferase [Ignavibacteriales bacterium]|nr:isoprenyl transferase [Ignavibacteriaceae bacterium]NLH60497.1 isoprenyl transferase [Ignavibacteriales bacterium]HOJ17996.1 isoprenyl transferase [Ignavibacteriaceae bacterium]
MIVKKKSKDEELQAQLKESGEIPKHVAIIMDGNGRWARKKGLHRIAGHRAGVESVRDIVEACAQLEVKYLTLYTFSTENWNRPKKEVSTLMKLLVKALKSEVDELHKNNIKLEMIGDFESLPPVVQQNLKEAKERTKNNTRLTLVLALSYSGRWEIIEAVKKIIGEANKGLVLSDDLCAERFGDYLTTKEIPDPDLLIRTSGEFRISNFLLWQIAYTEIFIADVFWPDFRRLHLYEAIKSFQKRERRYGKVSAQLQNKKRP